MTKHEEKLLRLWKVRQTQEGYDVHDVKTLEEAERFFDEKEPETVSFEDMTKAELVDVAEGLGVKVSATMKKSEIVELIEGR